ncbi:E3 SUMO-protein ligase ZBED1 [Frankliniella fusca]|uniref:E3 SUMO-protein ligase ZBED1 n=1 Tax=Frankliniella fusca TaxID=407009 RepID=A0AAE1HZ08_9NEOP|nr:E3 SUMO-protein ligase ZBED1 [Frankliniella fusca]
MAQSKVWNHFSKPFKTADGDTKVKCKMCNETLSYRSTTTNMRKHAKGEHKLVIPSQAPRGCKKRRTFSTASAASSKESDNSDIDSPPASTNTQNDTNALARSESASASFHAGPLDRCVNNINAFASGGQRDSECVNALMCMIAADNMPLRTPEKRGFKKFVKTLQPAFKIPCESVLTRLLEEKYEVLRERISRWIDEAQHQSLTCDIWTHKYAMKSYLGVTGHFRRGLR